MALPSGFNYDEENVPSYTLPDPLTTLEGKKVTTAAEWSARRQEILELFRSEVYGRQPKELSFTRAEILSEETALNGLAIRKQVRIFLTDKKERPAIDLLMYLPASNPDNCPTFVAMNFYGNHTIHSDPGILLSDRWVNNSSSLGIKNHKSTEAARGKRNHRWPVEMILKRGYSLCAFYYGDVDPDFNDGFENGVHEVLDEKHGDDRPADAWGSVASWAWGCSKVMDYLETDSAIDHKNVAVFGHSRLGKTSLWAGAEDERFALVISNDSGCGGAALSRRAFGETVKRINTSFPHWFCRNFRKYNDNENALPVDQHMLISLIAPRAVYIGSAKGDLWADPKGEFLSGKLAEPVYSLFGKDGLGVADHPEVDKAVGETIRYHMRSGGHDVKEYDWEQYLKAADAALTNE